VSSKYKSGVIGCNRGCYVSPVSRVWDRPRVFYDRERERERERESEIHIRQT